MAGGVGCACTGVGVTACPMPDGGGGGGGGGDVGGGGGGFGGGATEGAEPELRCAPGRAPLLVPVASGAAGVWGLEGCAEESSSSARGRTLLCA